MRKGQTEFIGLAFIVLLFILGLIFFLSFYNPEEGVSTEEYMTKIPTKTLQTMLSTTTSCHDQEVRVLLRDVADNLQDSKEGCEDRYINGTKARELQIGCDNGEYSDSYSWSTLFNESEEGVIPQILDDSLEHSRINYEFSAEMKDGCEIYTEKYNNDDELTGCEDADKITAKTFPIPSKSGTLLVQLRLC